MWRREPDVDPADVGMDLDILERIADEFERTCASGERFHGAQMALYREGRCVLDVGGGFARVRTEKHVTEDTLFVMFSCTKALASLAMLMLYERGKFHYDEHVVRYWPEFARVMPEKAGVTIRHVLSHRAGFPGGPDWLIPRWWGDRVAIRRAMEEVEMSFAPGEKNAYHALNFGHMVNELIERIDGRDCGRFLAEEVFAPLGLEDVYVGLPKDDRLEARVAWCYNEMDLSNARATGVVAPGHESDAGQGAVALARGVGDGGAASECEVPELAHPFNRPEIHRAVLPAAGGIATARDLTEVLAVLSLGGERDGVQLVSREGLGAATAPTNRADEIDGTVGWPLRWSTGFALGFHGEGSTLRTFGHGGAGGQETFADPDRRLAWGFLVNGELSKDFIDWRYGLQSLAFAACRD